MDEFEQLTGIEDRQPPRPPRRRLRLGWRGLSAVALGLVTLSGGIGIGHVVWKSGGPVTSLTNSSPANRTPHSTNVGNSGGSYELPFGGYGFGNSGASSGSGESSSNASGGPTNAAALAAGVTNGLVDINTTLSYQSAEAAGTGIVISKNGEILTNNHVITGATSISVTDLQNGKTYGATVVGYDRSHDIAVLQLKNASGLTVASLGNSSTVHVGDAVVGVGNAGGAGGTPSYAGGAVTGTGQSITASDASAGTEENLTNLIGTNAQIEAGDSGGALVNAAGRVIGIDTAGSSSAGGFGFSGGTSETSGYAIPINQALRIAHSIENHKASATVHIGATAFLGVEVSTSQASSYGNFGNYGGYNNSVNTTPGALIAGVITNAPIARAGLSTGDTITGINGKAVTSPSSLTKVVQTLKPQQNISITYVDTTGSKRTTTVRLGSGPPQ